MAEGLLVDPDALRERVREKYREVAVDPRRAFHSHTGRPLAARLRYEAESVEALPDRAVESFAGVGNPFSMRRLEPAERVVDIGSGAGIDSVVAAGQVGSGGRVAGVDMTAEMLEKARTAADAVRRTSRTSRRARCRCRCHCRRHALTLIARGASTPDVARRLSITPEDGGDPRSR